MTLHVFGRHLNHRVGASFWIMGIAICLVNCSIPNLETEQCSNARDNVKEFYSWYLGTDSDLRLKQRDVYDRHISPSFRSQAGEGMDPFFLSENPPTTFKVGKCEIVDDRNVNMQVQLYWRHDLTTDQKEVIAHEVKNGEKWLIEYVTGR